MSVRVTVLIRAFDAERYLAGAIASVLTQSVDDLELLIVDDGSTDRTREIVAAARDPRIRLLLQDHRGASAAYDRGIREARGVYVAMLDADDAMVPERLEHQLAEFERDPGLAVVGSYLEIVDENGEPVGIRRYPLSDAAIRREALVAMPFANPSITFVRAAAIDCGGVTARFRTAEDYDFVLRLLRSGRGANVPEALVRYRIHRRSTKSTKTKLQLRETIAARAHAIETYGYRATPRSIAADLAQRAMLALPARVINAAFETLYFRKEARRPADVPAATRRDRDARP